MKKTILALLAVILPMLAAAQDARPFDVKVVNDEYKIYIRMNLHDKNLTVPGQDVLGQVDGYIASTQSRSTWIIIASEIIDERTARIEVVNDYGSEDFTAEVKLRGGERLWQRGLHRRSETGLRRHVLVQENRRQHAQVRRQRQVAEDTFHAAIREKIIPAAAYTGAVGSTTVGNG